MRAVQNHRQTGDGERAERGRCPRCSGSGRLDLLTAMVAYYACRECNRHWQESRVTSGTHTESG
jgi:transposase-like protein